MNKIFSLILLFIFANSYSQDKSYFSDEWKDEFKAEKKKNFEFNSESKVLFFEYNEEEYEGKQKWVSKHNERMKKYNDRLEDYLKNEFMHKYETDMRDHLNYRNDNGEKKDIYELAAYYGCRYVIDVELSPISTNPDPIVHPSEKKGGYYIYDMKTLKKYKFSIPANLTFAIKNFDRVFSKDLNKFLGDK